MLPTTASPRAGTFVEQQIKGIRAQPLSVDVLHIDRAAGGMRSYWTTSTRIREKIQAHRPDLMHVMYGGVMAFLATRNAAGTPTVVSFCGTDLLGEESGPIGGRLRGALGVWCSRQAAAKADWVVVKSRNLESALPESVDRSRVSVIPNGVDLDRFCPLDREMCRSTLGWDPSVFHVLFAFGEHGGTNKRLSLAERAVKELGARGTAASLHVMSTVRHEDVPIWLNAADCVLLTSMHEGSPNIVKEALACNRPVVSVDVGDVRERLEGIGGCFIAAPNPSAIADCLKTVVTGPRVTQGRERMEKLSLDCVAQKLVEVYKLVL